MQFRPMPGATRITDDLFLKAMCWCNFPHVRALGVGCKWVNVKDLNLSPRRHLPVSERLSPSQANP